MSARARARAAHDCSGRGKAASLQAGVVALAIGIVGCSHLATEDRYPSKAQVVQLKGCRQKLESLRALELELFHVGFVRKSTREDKPVPFELMDNLISGEPRLVEYVKSDFEKKRGGSEPYREYRNRYLLSACEEPGGDLYFVVVRHDPPSGDRFLGARMSEALSHIGCEKVEPVAKPRNIGFYKSTTEEDLLRHIRRGRCREYGMGK